jgi:hypothetical protein
VEATAETLYEAVAHALRVFRDADWAGETGQTQAVITVAVKQPEVVHRVRVSDFESWLEAAGRSPAESSLKERLRRTLRG